MKPTKKSKPRTIAFLTSLDYERCVNEGTYINQFPLLRDAFARRGVALEAIHWARPRSESTWKRISGVLPIAAWNYTEQAPKFVAFLKALAKRGIPSFNSAATVEWNHHKRYLLELEERGFPTLPTLYLKKGSSRAKIEKLALGISGEVVVKPTVSSGAKNTIRIKKDAFKSKLGWIEKKLQHTDLLVQPFVERIASYGELSFLFFGGKFSHALLKSPKAKDFRTQTKHGAKNTPYRASKSEIAEASHFLAASKDSVLAYARVDVVKLNGKFHLMELEVIEPYLYLECTDRKKAAELFADAVMSQLE